MQESIYKEDGEIKRMVEMFNLPTDGSAESVMRRKYEEAVKRTFGEDRELLSIKQAKIGRNDPCPCGSGMKFKRCCEAKLNMEVRTGGY